MNISGLVALLQAVIIMLTSSIGTPVEQQARQIADQALIIAYQGLQSEQVASVPIIIEEINEPIKEVKSMRNLEIISPFSNKGLGREYLSGPLKDEKNYIELGLLITDEKGKSINGVDVSVTATDSSQDRTMNGTGNITKVYKDGHPREIYYYPFHYEFKSEGEHVIIFKTDTEETSVTISAKKDERE